MAGLFGLFGGKPKDDTNKGKQVKPRQPQPRREAFYLEPDDAKTMGNTEFMRKRNKIRRTFPKTKSREASEFIQEISSIDKIIDKVPNKNQSSFENQTTTSFSSTNNTQPQVQKEDTNFSAKRRSADTSMDFFRNMAKDIKK